MKAHSHRSDADRLKKPKAELRPSSVVVKKAPAAKVTLKAAAPVKAAKPAAASKAPTAKVVSAPKSNGAAKTKALATTKPAGKAAAPAKPPAKPAPAKPVATAKPAAGAKPAVPKAAVASKAAPAKSAAAEKLTGARSALAAKLPLNAKGKAVVKAEAAPPAPALPKKPARKSIKEAAGVSTDAVARRTGKTWDDWFEVLDTAGAATLDQRGIIAILAQKHGIGPWWQQMIAVGYESVVHKSDKPVAPDGFHINSSCTLDAPVSRVFRLWNESGERARWLADDRFVVRAVTADKVIRARWGKGNSHVAVSFAEKSGRTEVSVEHHQIESRGAADQMKAYWAKKLGLLDEALAPRR